MRMANLVANLLELVLVYCCFLSFKTRNSLTVQVANEDLALWGERKLFQA